MNEEQKQNLLKYEKLKIQEKEIKEQLDTLKDLIVPLIPEGTKLTALYGAFELKKRSNWTFTPDTQAKEESLKAIKAEEIAKGLAVDKPTVYVEYRATKKQTETSS